MPFTPTLLLKNFDGGANSKDHVDALEANQSPNPRGVDFTARTIRKAKGYTVLGMDADAVGNIGFKAFNLRVLSTDEILIKTIGTKIKFYDETADVWYSLTDATFTANKRWWFASFNGYLYGGNDTDIFIRWRGSSWSTLATAVTAASTSIVLAAGTGSRYAATGSGMIEDDTFTWTGVSTDTLTGVTGLSSNHAIGARVIEKLDSTTYSANPKGSLGAFYKNRIYTRSDASANFLYFSKLADNTDPQGDLANFTIAGSGSGDAGFIIFPAALQTLRTFISGDNTPVLVAICADGIAYAASVTDTGGATVGLATVFKVLGADAAGDDTIAETENTLLFADSFGTLRAMGYTEANTTLQTTRESDIIAPTILPSLIDFSAGTAKYFDRRAFFIGKQSGATINNFTVVKDTNPKAYAFYNHWNFNCLVEWKNNLYGLSSLNGNMMKLFDGLSVELLKGGTTYPIYSSYPTGEFDFGVPLIFKELQKIRLQGLISNGCELTYDVYFDGVLKFSFVINGNDTDIVDVLSGVSFGHVVYARAPTFGGGSTGGTLLQSFTAELCPSTLGYFWTLQVVVTNNQKDVDFELDKMLFFSKQALPDIFPPARIITPS